MGESEPKDVRRDRETVRQQQLAEQADSGGLMASCPDCACTDLALISDGQFVTVYKCPRCGKLLAPVKQR